MIESKNFDEAVLANGGMNEIETFYGLVENTTDALRIVELCRQGKLGRVSRRLHDKERKQIRSGSVFVFDEMESGIKRWTDGRIWSPSRILGNFLIYRELERKPAAGQGEFRDDFSEVFSDDFIGEDYASRDATVQRDPELVGLLPWLTEPILKDPTNDGGGGDALEEGLEVLQSKKLLTNHKGHFTFKPGGLIKKTISIKVNNHPHHLICYYNKQDFCHGHLGSSSNLASSSNEVSPFKMDLLREIKKIWIPEDLVAQQSFRKPVVLNMSQNPAFPHENQDLFGQQEEDLYRETGSELKKSAPKRRSSFPGGTPTSRLRREAGSNCGNPYYVPILPASANPSSSSISSGGSSSETTTGIPFTWGSMMQPLPEPQPNVSSGFELMSGLYLGETPPESTTRDDLPNLSISSCNLQQQQENQQPDFADENNPINGLKWNAWLTSPDQSHFRDEQNGKGATSPVLREDPMLTSIRPPSTIYDIEKTPPSYY